ncbi:unnamed protein product [Soboliphyme baturini]|uniref:PlsC domain-containing protein n=1 Tax=Soboliphyme baturini TaxID=241478 RepID=A0A183IGE3_9BILA|nr:unnamed protein product [Soboliphyme baturini]
MEETTQTLPNPFVNNIHFGARDRVKIALMTVFVFPVRLMLAAFLIGVAYLAAVIILFQYEVELEAPLKGWRKRGKEFVARVMVYLHFVLGVFPVTVKGRRAEPWEAPILVVAPHSSFYDALPYCLLNAPSFIGKSSLINMPVFGKLISLTKPILVNRDMKKSRKMTAEKLKERAWKVYNQRKNGITSPLSQIMIFPEGTCTNRTQLIHFKAGAFAAQLPIQPVCLRWPESSLHTAWTWEGPGM